MCLYGLNQLIDPDGLVDMPLIATAQGPLDIIVTNIATQCYCWNLSAFFGWKGANLLQEGVAIHLWHPNIADQNIELKSLQAI